MFLPQTIEFKIKRFPADGGPIWAPATPLRNITEIRYTDGSGVATTLNEAAADLICELDTYTEPHKIKLKYDQSWPDGTDVIIKVEAGYVDSGSVPKRFKQAVAQLGSFLYHNPDNPAHRLPDVVDRLLMPTRLWRYKRDYAKQK